MTATQQADIFGFRKITKQCLLESCKKNKLYRTPGLNDVLYLHYQGFEDIECLEEYTGLKCIWLECNAISKISGFDNQKLLKCLFLHNNVIKKIENLECCPELDTVNLSHNHIIKIENCGIDKLPVLTTLNLSHNYLRTYDSLASLVDCKMLSVLDLANNRIEDILCVKIFAQMPELRVLVLQGNPVVNQIPQYRKTLILDCLNLTYLDSRPVFPRDRACAEAWKQGGYEAERIEHARWNREERKKMRQSVNATLRLKNRGGGDPQPQLLMSSDDEDAGATELSSAPSLEKEQMNKASSSSKLPNSSDDSEDSDSVSDSDAEDNENIEYICNTEKRCDVCARANCNVEHVKKRPRIRNVEDAETILENSFIVEEYQKETVKNQNVDEENKLYNDVYLKNIQYINDAINNENNNKIEDLNIENQHTADSTALTPVQNNIESFIQNESVDINESVPTNGELEEIYNSTQLLVRSRDQDSALIELSVLPPIKKIKLTQPEDLLSNTSESIPNSSQSNHIESDVEKSKKMQNMENILENPLKSDSDAHILDETEKIIMKDNKNVQLIDMQSEGTLEIECNEHTNCILTEINDDNKILKSNDNTSEMNSKIEENHSDDLDANVNCTTNEENIVKEGSLGKNEINDELISNEENATNYSPLNFNIKKAIQQVKDNNSYIMNTFPILFSSKLYLGTDTNINSAIALYEMNNKREYISDDESNDFETIYKKMKDDEKSKTSSTNNTNVIEPENMEPKMDIIDRLLKNPITKTYKYDSTKIHEDFEILKGDVTKTYNPRLKTFLEIQNNKTETINPSDFTCKTKDLGIHISKSEEIIVQNDLDTDDDDDKNMIETHSSDTRIIKINYNI